MDVRLMQLSAADGAASCALSYLLHNEDDATQSIETHSTQRGGFIRSSCSSAAHLYRRSSPCEGALWGAEQVSPAARVVPPASPTPRAAFLSRGLQQEAGRT